MTVRISGGELKAMLYGQEGTALLRNLIPGGRLKGHYFTALAPHRLDRKVGSFVVYADAARFGGWRDYATGETGDLIDLIALVQRTDQAGALAWARQRLGLDRADPAKIREVKRQAAERRRVADEDEAKRLERRRARAFEIYAHARPLRDDTRDCGKAVRAYLNGRGIDLCAIPLLTDDVRSTVIEHWMTAEYVNGRKLKMGWYGPAMVCPVRDLRREGVITGVHCTWVALDGQGKAPVRSPKLMLGEVKGGVICLTGEALTGDYAGVTASGEGVEDGLTAAMEFRGEVWAVTSLGNLAFAPYGLDRIRAGIVMRDNDWSKPQATAAFNDAMDSLREYGKPMAVVQSHIGKDFNDMVKEGEGDE